MSIAKPGFTKVSLPRLNVLVNFINCRGLGGFVARGTVDIPFLRITSVSHTWTSPGEVRRQFSSTPSNKLLPWKQSESDELRRHEIDRVTSRGAMKDVESKQHFCFCY